MNFILFLLFYIGPILLLRKWIKNAYSEGGVWRYQNVGTVDIVLVLIPFVNFLLLLLCIVYEGSWNGKKRPKNRNGSFAEKFFNIKN